MLCPSCGHESESSERFCVRCGHVLSSTCSECGVQLPPNAKFCGSCGKPISEARLLTLHEGPPATPRSMPAFFKNGRYLVKEFLGEGSTKRVFLVHDTLLDRDVAFALIRTELLDRIGHQRILREAQTMGRLGDHPNIVQIYDMGDEGGQPYMVLPVMEGGHLEDAIQRAPDGRLPVDECVKTASQVARGLTYAHDRGIVHRDLKPGNVWLTAEGIAKIGDFGLAMPLDRSRITEANVVVGTVWYMSPEQATGAKVGKNSDLYSLGCVLYQMLTERPVFLGEDSASVLSQHISSDPVAPSLEVPECPEFLEELVLRLLRKDPSERPASAAQVVQQLDEIAAILRLARHRPEAALHGSASSETSQPGIVGRNAEMALLRDALEGALSGRGGVVLLEGEAGMGKTRLSREVAAQAALGGAQVWTGRCQEEQGNRSYWPWVQAIRSYVRQQSPKKIRSQVEKGGTDLAEIVSEVRDSVPDLDAPGAAETVEQARSRLFLSIAGFLESVAQAQPLLIILDDIHLADAASVELLELIAGRLGGSRLLVVATFDETELAGRESHADTLLRLQGERLVRMLRLGGLTEREVGQLVETRFDVTPSPALTSEIHGQTGGNPLFVSELLRLKKRDSESHSDTGWEKVLADVATVVQRLGRSQGLLDVIARRIRGLSAECEAALSTFAVAGVDFEHELLRLLAADGTVQRLPSILREAVSEGIIEAHPDSAQRFQFVHHLVQQTLAGRIPSAQRAQCHWRVAEALERLYGPDAEIHASELAFHLTRSDGAVDAKKVVWYSLIAGEQALSAYAYEEAMSHFEVALSARQRIPAVGRAPALAQIPARSRSAGFGLE